MPSADSIITLRNDLRREYSALFGEFKVDQAWYDNQVAFSTIFPKWAAQEMELTIIPFAAQRVNTFTDHIVNSKVRVLCPVNPKQVQSRGPDGAHKVRGLRQDILTALHRKTNHNPEGIRYRRDAAKFLALRGQAAVELEYDHEDYQETGFGYRFRTRDPWSLLPDPSLDGKTFVIREWKSPARAVRALYPKAVDDAVSDTYEVEMFRYCDKEQYWTFVGDTPVGEPQDNPFGFLPFVWAHNGLGLTVEQARPGLSIGERHVVRSRSLLYPVRGLMANRIKMDTLGMVAISMSAIPFIKLINMAGDEAIDWGPGKGLRLRREPNQPEEDVEFAQLPTLDPNFNFFTERIGKEMDRATVTSVTSGIRQPGTSSGFEFDSQLQQARMMFGEAQESLAGALERLGEMVQQHCFENKQSLTVEFQDSNDVQAFVTKTLTAKDIGGFYANTVELLAPGQDELDERKLQGNLALAANPAGPSFAWATRDVPNLDRAEERRNKLKESIYAHPALAEAIVGVVAQALGIEAQKDIAQMQTDAGLAQGADAAAAAMGGTAPQGNVTAGFLAGEQQSFNRMNQIRQARSTLLQQSPGYSNQTRQAVPPLGGPNA